jgi:hypothetical protein
VPTPPKDEPPGFSVTWLLRIQRRGRRAVRRGMATGFSRWFPWAVLLLLLAEVALFVWLGLLPRI